MNYKDLPQGFITYDTIYTIDGAFAEYYPLPKTELIILTLFTDSEQCPKVWTTVRRYTPKKYEYYCRLITKQIEVIFNDFEKVCQCKGILNIEMPNKEKGMVCMNCGKPVSGT